MMHLQTPVVLDKAPVTLSYSDTVLVLGSCFADALGARLAEAGFDALCNPFGPLYNPVSLCNAIARLQSAVPFSADDVVEMGAGAGLFCSFWHHTSFARESRERFLEHANASLQEAAAFWHRCNRVVITLGTAWAFKRNDTGETVANCLKRPAAEFTRYRVGLEAVSALLHGLVARYPDKRFIFTVSPIRHLADGAHSNQLSKSTLLLATEGLPYFPSYEIMMDELRDYRWWAEDMVHPTEQAERYICDRFMEWTLVQDDKARYEEALKAARAARHRPHQPFSTKAQ